MTNKSAIKRTFKRINKEYPLLRKSLRAYFIELILLTYENFKLDESFDNMTDSEKLNYSYEINTNDEYHGIIDDFNKNYIYKIDEYLKLYDYYSSISKGC